MMASMLHHLTISSQLDSRAFIGHIGAKGAWLGLIETCKESRPGKDYDVGDLSPRERMERG